MNSAQSSFDGRVLLAGGCAILGGSLLIHFFPGLKLDVFARSAAWLVGFFTGAPVSRAEEGWIVLLTGAPSVVTRACSATDYFVLVAGVIAFHLARRRGHLLGAFCYGIGAALPIAIVVNAVRIITVSYAHPWFISRLPVSYEAFLHMLAGAVVFLPSLIALNLLLEIYGCRHHSASH